MLIAGGLPSSASSVPESEPDMEMKIEHWPEKNILYLRTRGVMDKAAANALVKDLVQAAADTQCIRHLIDHRAVTFAFSLIDYYERPAINEAIGISLEWKTAMVFAESTSDTRFMETVFRNRGYNFREFTDIDQALEWLQQD
ncbi:MAG TPA: hypothetical protein VGJ22_12360 [Anaerolineales bacterium]|jgi:hypothetical protein